MVIAALVSVLVVALRGSGFGRSAGSQGARITLDPAQRSDSEAAVRNGWTMIAHDEFDGDTLNEDHWSPYKGRTTDDVGRHDPDNLSVSDGTLKLASRGNTSAGLSWDDGQKYGRWEARVRSEKGNGYGPVMLLWPDAEDWPEGGEIDIMEIPKGDRTKANFTVHWGEDNKQDGKSVPGRLHPVAHVRRRVDARPHRRLRRRRGDLPQRGPRREPAALHALRDAAGHRPVRGRLDPAPDASTPATCTFEVDWVRIYAA